jgi:hypothetical protein
MAASPQADVVTDSYSIGGSVGSGPEVQYTCHQNRCVEVGTVISHFKTSHYVPSHFDPSHSHYDPSHYDPSHYNPSHYDPSHSSSGCRLCHSDVFIPVGTLAMCHSYNTPSNTQYYFNYNDVSDNSVCQPSGGWGQYRRQSCDLQIRV